MVRDLAKCDSPVSDWWRAAVSKQSEQLEKSQKVWLSADISGRARLEGKGSAPDDDVVAPRPRADPCRDRG